jgi:hypothetical protein
VADQKISDLTDGTTPDDADEFPVARAAANAKLSFSEIKAAIKAYTDTLYPSGSGTSTGTNTGDQTSVSGNAGTATALATGRTIDGQTFDGTANITVVAPGTHAATGKTTPVDADELPLVDSAASNVLKKLTWANLKATIKSYTDTLYPSGSGTSSGTNTGDQTSVSGNAGTATALQTGRAIDGQSFDGTAAITVIAPGTHAATSKTTPVDADELPLVDSAASNVLKRLTWANLKATVKAYTDTLYPSGSGTSTGTNTGDQTLPTDATITTTDVTTNNVTSTKHGWAPKSGADATTFLNGAATPAYAAVKDSDLATTDITTNNVSTSKHGFAPKLPNDATKYLDGTGAYSVPAGGGSTTKQVRIPLSTPDSSGNGYAALVAPTNFREVFPAFLKDVDGDWWGVVRVPMDYSSGGKVVLRVAANSTAGQVCTMKVSTIVRDTAATWDAALTAETQVDTTMSTTAYRPSDVSFTLSTTPAAGKDLLVKITHVGTAGNDTLAVDTLLFNAVFEYTT